MTTTGPVVMGAAAVTGSLASVLRTDQASIANLQYEVASGRSVTVASDNPIEASNILRIGSSVDRARQYAANAQGGISRLSLANTTVNSIMNVLQQVQSAVEGLSSYETSGTASAISGVSAVVSNARKELIDLANTQYASQAIFSGTGTPQRAYDASGVYMGAGTAPTVTVSPGTAVAASVTGPAVFGPTGPTSLLGPTGVLATISGELASGTPTSLAAAATTGLTAVQTAMARVSGQAAKLGADYQAMQGFSNQATGMLQSLQEELANAQDVTMAQAATNLQAQNTAYQAALYVTSQLHNNSLVNYL